MKEELRKVTRKRQKRRKREHKKNTEWKEKEKLEPGFGLIIGFIGLSFIHYTSQITSVV
jgi:hypothetical protein